MTVTVAYCTDCGWVRRTGEGCTRPDLDRAMIDHYVESGHSLVEAVEGTDLEDAPDEVDLDLAATCDPDGPIGDSGDARPTS